MRTYDLPYYENVFCARMAFIEPFCTNWEVVTVNHLLELRNCLFQEWVNFQRAIIDDARSGSYSFYCVTSVYQTLKKFSRWFHRFRNEICMALGNTIKHIANKADLARQIANFIEIVWFPFMLKLYDSLRNESKGIQETLTSQEIKLTRKLSKDEENREKAIRKLYSVITGTTDDEKRVKSEILQEVLNGMKGKTVATYLQAAIELNWLSEIPEFSIMKIFWGVEGSQGAISKVFSTVGGSLINEETLGNAKEELLSKMSR